MIKKIGDEKGERKIEREERGGERKVTIGGGKKKESN